MERVDFKIKEIDKKEVAKRTYKFALRTLYIAQKLSFNPVTNKIIGQLVGSGTSIGSNTEEASAGFSKNDFTFKMSIASKEAREVNPVRNSSGVLNPALRGGTPYGAEPGIILKSNPAAAAGPEGLWPGGSSEALFLTE
ncbi:MAG: four helix bundle protein [Thermodesulfobacteriota bacterium]|jgi:hypothetical protein